RYRTLGLVHLEAQPPFDEPDHTGHHPVPCAFASDVNVRVVGVAHEVVAAPGKLTVEFVQHDITEQRRQHSPNAKGNFDCPRGCRKNPASGYSRLLAPTARECSGE